MLEVSGPVALQKRPALGERKGLATIDDKNGSPTFVQIGEMVRRGPGETIDGVALASAIRSLREESYDYIVIDAPPVLGSSETNLIGEAADAILVTCRTHSTLTGDVVRAIDQLAPLPVLGVVMLNA